MAKILASTEHVTLSQNDTLYSLDAESFDRTRRRSITWAGIDRLHQALKILAADLPDKAEDILASEGALRRALSNQ
jgi:hypothetical protein